MMKNLTLSVEEAILQQARRRAASENTTISDLVRSWLERYVAQPSAADQYLELMESLRHVEAGRKYTREEMNERRCVHALPVPLMGTFPLTDEWLNSAKNEGRA